MAKTNSAARLQTLLRIASLRSDLALTALSRANQACERTHAQLQSLDLPPASPDLPPLVMAQKSLLYDRWAEPKRIQLNIRLAAQRAEAAQLHHQAQQDFGRYTVLIKLCGRTPE